MLRSLNDLRGYKLHAVDGELGSMLDLLFDDVTWRIRYFVADTGGWLSGRRVLLSPESVRQAAWPGRQIYVALTKQQIKESPPIDAQPTLSRQQEMAMVEYYGWPSYWAGPNLGAMPLAPIAPVAAQVERSTGVIEGEEPDPHLRALQEVRGYHIAASDGAIGHLEDLVVEDDDWTIRYLVVDTRNWIPGRKVLVAPCWAQAFHWVQREVRVDLTREQIKNSPAYDPAAPVNRSYEMRLYDYYGRPAYW